MNTSFDSPDGRYGSDPAGASDPSARPRHKRLFRWGAGITLAGFLAGGGIALAATSGGGTAAASTTSSTQAANLSSALNTASTTSAAVPARRVRSALERLRRIGGVDGVLTYHNKKGFHTVAFERGTIESVSGSDVTIKASDGTTWTWVIVGNTVVRKGGSKTTNSALTVGESVFAGGPVVNGAKDARLFVIRAPKSSGSGSTSTPTTAPSGSTSAQTSLT